MTRDVKLYDTHPDAASWTERFQPRTFDQIVGNEVALDYFRVRVHRRAEPRRSMILNGPFGCGKTTLSHVFANAMNCEQPEADGSPCLACTFCRDFRPFSSMVYDYHHCAEQGGGLEDVRSILASADGHPGKDRVRVIALDEAHALSPAAQDALLKRLERPQAATVFMLLTTRLDKLSVTIRSRCDDVAVQLIAPGEATAHARAICQHVEIDYEDEALALIVYKADGHLRDLVRDLERVAEGGPVTSARTRRVLSLDYLGHLLDLLTAVVQGAALEVQFAAVDMWQASAVTKATQLQELLLHLYLTELCHVRRPHPVYGVIEPSVRMALVEALSAKAAVRGLAVEEFWESVVAFWQVPEGDWTESELGLRLTQFNRYLNVQPAAHAPARISASRREEGHSARRTKRISSSKDVVEQEGGPWLTFEQARAFWNAGSFLVQEYGVLLNARLTFEHGGCGIVEHQAASKHFGLFMHALTTFLNTIDVGDTSKRSASEDFHWLYVHETDRNGALRTHLIAHIPPKAWPRVRRWFRSRTCDEAQGANVRPATQLRLLNLHRPERALLLHHNYLRLLCRGLSRTVTDGDNPVVDLLAVPKRWQGAVGRVTCAQRGRVSKTIGEGAQRRSAQVGLAMLSVVDRHAWGEHASGWELKEHKERECTKKAFAQEEAIALALIEKQPEPLREPIRAKVLRAMIEKRPKAAHARQRDEPGWWSPCARRGTAAKKS